MVGVAFDVIPDEWLLPPEQSESDKRIRSLEERFAKLSRVEPEFQITCVDEKVTGARSWCLKRHATTR